MWWGQLFCHCVIIIATETETEYYIFYFIFYSLYIPLFSSHFLSGLTFLHFHVWTWHTSCLPRCSLIILVYVLHRCKKWRRNSIAMSVLFSKILNYIHLYHPIVQVTHSEDSIYIRSIVRSKCSKLWYSFYIKRQKKKWENSGNKYSVFINDIKLEIHSYPHSQLSLAYVTPKQAFPFWLFPKGIISYWFIDSFYWLGTHGQSETRNKEFHHMGSVRRVDCATNMTSY